MAVEVSPILGLPMVDDRCWKCKRDNVYRMVGRCINCGSRVVGLFTVGHETRSGVLGPRCPICGCAQLRWKGLEDEEGAR